MVDIDTDYLERPIKTLVIEDNPGDVRLLQTYMQGSTKLSGDFTSAETLREGIELLDQDAFDLVFLDLNLPDSQGLETLHRLLEQHLDVPIVILTGLDDERLGVAAVKAGAQDFLVKGTQVSLILERTIRHALERHRLQRTLRELALRDDLTQLYNRRGFRLLGQQALELSRRKGFPVAMLFIDVNGLKYINDHYGHPAGDQALSITAEVVRHSYRASDVVARVGGDEFVIMAVDCNQEDGQMLRERLLTSSRAAAAAADLPFDLELSVGLECRTNLNDVTISELLTEADEAMYETRRNRRREEKRRKDWGEGSDLERRAQGSDPETESMNI